MFALIKFPEEDDRIAVVPVSWYKNGVCKWPKSKSVLKFAKSSCFYDETWESYPATIMKIYGKQFISILSNGIQISNLLISFLRHIQESKANLTTLV